MLCQSCKKNMASVNFTQSVNGVSCAVHLCADCANRLFGEFENNFAGAYSSGLFEELFREEKVCSSCGLRFSDYQKSGLLGCPSCYDVFNEELMPYIARIQGKTEHVGKKGGVNTDEHDKRLKLQFLQVAMEEALGRGDYVAANKINQQMKLIGKRPTGGTR